MRALILLFTLIFTNIILNGQCCVLNGSIPTEHYGFGLECGDGDFCVGLNCSTVLFIGDVVVTDGNGNSENIAVGEWFPNGTTNTICNEALLYHDECGVQSYSTSLVISCNTQPIDLGMIDYYPNPSFYILQVTAAGCGQNPAFEIPQCGTFTLGEYQAPTDTEDGFQKYTYVTGLDLSNAPDCYGAEDVIDECYIIPKCEPCPSGHGILDVESKGGNEE